MSTCEWPGVDPELVDRKSRNAFRLRSLLITLRDDFDGLILDTEELKNFRVKITRLDPHAQENGVAGQQQFFTPQPLESYQNLAQPEYKVRSWDYSDIWDSYDAALGLDLDRRNHLFRTEIPAEKRKPETGLWMADGHAFFDTWHDYKHLSMGGVVSRHPQPYWKMQSILFTDPEKKSHPHALISVCHKFRPNENSDNTVVRGEILAALNVMHWRIHMTVFGHDELFPILILSYWGRSARIVQAHFDGVYFHMALSPFLDFDASNNQEYWDLLARWSLCMPVGDTKVPTNSPVIGTLPALRATPSTRWISEGDTKIPKEWPL
ncbi:hypothetical protein EMPG_14728 [Blastomyces silverae]|uniref:Uncharacterized protein n=1 Tax=Blastomyces silverae TaxID=2060906 RepID=A0A0H1BFS1_9EURO|nr:hypothetical protein EMPG_14728 [Blastomyces silverae]